MFRNVALALDHHQLDLLPPVHWCVPTPLHCCCVLKVARASQRSFSSLLEEINIELKALTFLPMTLYLDTARVAGQVSIKGGVVVKAVMDDNVCNEDNFLKCLPLAIRDFHLLLSMFLEPFFC